METKEVKHIPSMSVFTSELIEVLSKGKKGDTFTDEELTEICGRSTKVGEKGYGNLQSAINYLVREKGIVWQRVREAGMIKCLGDKEILEASNKSLKKINREAKKTNRKLDSVETSNLNEDEIRKYAATKAQIGTLVLMTKGSTNKRLVERNINYTPSIESIQKLFKDGV